ncbi:MAG: hypothetical protein US50_C0009G0002 [Candidatus Nomurabacteria bacterium GW2011_GWB1_37_5]|uniref:Uncharacterized protein n=1 Tax=Candidatus Nomurabacteria bacterium GW2011_GWB1_37_5 TaxID=1618742 RepID=A0A0G0K4T7_9BACT|nr:MAG: hypothetical protein US50_C0009G0002 [Candidatus Nomurabacteria bacterium GW2011_GWB1_37_5]
MFKLNLEKEKEPLKTELKITEKEINSFKKEFDGSSPERKIEIGRLVRNIVGPALITVLAIFSSNESQAQVGNPYMLPPGIFPGINVNTPINQPRQVIQTSDSLTTGQKMRKAAVLTGQAGRTLQTVGIVLTEASVFVDILQAGKQPKKQP